MIYRAISKGLGMAWAAIVAGVIWWIASAREPRDYDHWEQDQW